MTKEIRENKNLRIFTFCLVSITILGVGTIFLRTDYAKLYTIWLVKRYRQIQKIYDSLNIDQKKQLHSLVRKGKDKTIEEVEKLLDEAGVKKEHSKIIVDTGSTVVKKVISEVKKVVK